MLHVGQDIPKREKHYYAFDRNISPLNSVDTHKCSNETLFINTRGTPSIDPASSSIVRSHQIQR